MMLNIDLKMLKLQNFSALKSYHQASKQIQ